MPEVIFRKRGDDWCLQSDEKLDEGAEVVVTKKSGSTTKRTVGRLIEHADGKYFYATAGQQSSGPSYRTGIEPKVTAIAEAFTGKYDPSPDEIGQAIRTLLAEVYGPPKEGDDIPF